MGRSGEQTREQLLDAAERLFATRGITGVSLREVGDVAGARNKSAAQYHFGDRDGLVRAIFARRMEPLNQMRLEMLDAAGPHPDLRQLVSALVEPFAAAVSDQPNGSHYAQFVATMITETHSLSTAALEAPFVTGLRRIIDALHVRLQDLPAALRRQRIDFANTLLVHSLADFERTRDAGLLDAGYTTADLTDALCDSLVGILQAVQGGRHMTAPPRITRLPHGVNAGPRVLRRLPEGVDSKPYDVFDLHAVSPTIGAQINGIQLRDVDDATLKELHRALLEWKVLFFRDQQLTGVQQRDFAARWGELEVHPFLPPGASADVVRFSKDEQQKGTENIWHSDVTWRVAPSMGAVLRCVEAPEVGGDTIWVDMYSAYDCLDPEVRARVDGLQAVHDFTTSFGLGMTPEKLAEMQQKFPAVEHPVVRTHPETGRKLLYVNGVFTSHIVGMDAAESDALLDVLCAQAATPEYQCRFHWEPGSVAMWDNRCTQHYACSDYWPHRRVMERISIIGDRPF